MTVAEQAKVLRFFAIDLTQYSTYDEVRQVVERSDAVPLRAPGLPYEPPLLSVFVVLRVHALDVEADYRLSLDLTGDGSGIMARHEETLRLPTGVALSDPASISFVVNLAGLVFDHSGTYETRLSLDGEEIDRLPVEVVDVSGEA